MRPKRFPTDGAPVTFANRPVHVSKEGLLKGVGDFADVLGLCAYGGRPRADLMTLRWVDRVGLTIQLTKEEKLLFEKTYRLGEEMALTEEGRILLKPRHDWHSGGGYAGAYERKQLALFIDDDDNLVVVESSDSLSLFLIVPVPGHWRLISIFPRAGNTSP